MLAQSLMSALMKLKTERGLSETELARDLKLPVSMVKRILQGEVNLPINTVEYMAERLQVSPLDLITGFQTERVQLASLCFLLQLKFDLPEDRQWKAARSMQKLLAVMADTMKPEEEENGQNDAR